MMPNASSRIYKEILQLAESYCGKRPVAKFLATQKKARLMENRILHRTSGGFVSAALPAEEPCNEHIVIDHLLTFCREQLPSEDRYHEVLLGVGNIYKMHSEYNLAEKAFTDVISYGRQKERGELVAEAFLQRGDIFSRLARWEDSIRDLDASRELAQKSGNESTLTRIYNILGTSYAEQGLLADAKRCFTKALRSADQTHQRSLGAMIVMNLGIIHNISGDWDEALANYRRALSLFESTGEIVRIAEVHHNAGMSHMSKKDYPAALQSFNRSIDYAAKAGNPHLLGLGELGKANVFFSQNDLPLALAFCNRALEYFKKSDDRMGTADAYKVKGMILAAMKKDDLAMPYFRSSLRINNEHKNILNRGETYFQIGVMQYRRRRRTDAADAFREAKKNFQKVGARADVEETRRKLSELKKDAK